MNMSELPPLFLERMARMLSTQFPLFLDSYTQNPWQALRFASEKTAPLQGKLPEALIPVPWESGAYYYPATMQPGKHPYHAAGVYYIQEPSAMYPVTQLDVHEGERILDLCSAPGGKAVQIATRMNGRGLLVCNEIHPLRAKILDENIERMGIGCAIVMNETPERLANRFPSFFDKILVDAPCSGEGMFRKMPQAALQWSPDLVTLCADRQDEILCHAAKMLAPGGRLVYSTCTFAPQENEGTIHRFLQTHTEFTLQKPNLFAGMQTGLDAWDGESWEVCKNTVRLLPHRLNGEGHFVAVMQKEGVLEDRWESKKTKTRAILSREQREFFNSFCKKTVTQEITGDFLLFGDHLYLTPSPQISLKGLKVLRPGLHIGTFQKNRFEPSHALALASTHTTVRQVYRIASEDMRIHEYLSGEALSLQQGEPDIEGWCLLTVDDFSIGWVKGSRRILKNHYPKGLRIPFSPTHKTSENHHTTR
jgi:16S rRNA C967 or C1407 C5-methylase (RsmB/RsmF family)/NOL1/NOP2/fmu family ribosome biogenesis protein